jgi:ABC-type glycerol-3-phosphate transport system substrate-binding protein
MRFPITRWLIVLVGSSLVAAACAGPADEDDEEAVPPEELAGEITVWAWEGAVEPLQELDEAFQEEYPNIEVSYEVQPPADTYQNLQLALTAGEGAPDVILLEDSNLAQFVELGGLVDLTDRVQPYVDRMNSYKWNAAEREGRYFAMPWDSGPVAVFYRRDIFEEAGVDPEAIETWDDYYEAAITIRDTVGVPMWQQSRAANDARQFEMFMWQRGVGYVDEEGAVILDTAPEIEEILEYMGRFWDEDLAADSEPWTDPWYKEMNDGEVATVPGAVWMGTFLKSFIAPETEGLWGVFRLPVWAPGDVQASNDGGSQLAITEQSEQQDEAWAYIDFRLGRADSQLRMYEVSDIFPSLEDTYEDAFFDEPDPYFDGQEVRSLFAEIVQEIPAAGVYNSEYAEMNEIMSVEIQRFATGRQSASDALSNAAQEIRERTGRS